MSKLIPLVIVGSNLTGTISSYAFQNRAPLKVVNLSGNNLTGSIPLTLASKTTVTRLLLQNNPLLSGPVPNRFVLIFGVE
ncbi:hypothetical protein BDR26DRAFT_1002997 [Obelidium mucronatum]|nr:hypothetical protein BDR26DRAFT_1002997 [Obelidium mucronatum]